MIGTCAETIATVYRLIRALKKISSSFSPQASIMQNQADFAKTFEREETFVRYFSRVRIRINVVGTRIQHFSNSGSSFGVPGFDGQKL
jgi:hypothetical protein